MIDTSRLGIHDISRCQSTQKKEWYRMNMPFEMGLDFGCGTFSKTHSDKHYLVLTKEPYTIQPALSDLSGNDPKCHGDNYEELMKIIRDFLYNQVEPEKKKSFPQKSEIRNDYLSFQTFLYAYPYTEDELTEMSDEEYSNKIEEFITGK